MYCDIIYVSGTRIVVEVILVTNILVVITSCRYIITFLLNIYLDTNYPAHRFVLQKYIYTMLRLRN